jgi:hypothetical protein
LRDKDTKKVKIGSVVIDAELGREDNSSILITAIRRELKSLDVITDL